jgi:hypothetical protein
LFACYETYSQHAALDEIYSFKQHTSELAVSLRVGLEALHERATAEGTSLQESQLVKQFVTALQQPYKDKMVPYPRTLDDAVETLTALENHAEENRGKINPVVNAVITGRHNANLSHNARTGARPGAVRQDHGEGRVSVKVPIANGRFITNYYIDGNPICRYCLNKRHVASDCPLRAQGKSPAKCTKCEGRWHPAEFCDRKAINAPSVAFAESTSAITEDVEDNVDHSDTVASLGSWSTEDEYSYANETDEEVINNVQLLSVLQPACIKGRILSKYTKIIIVMVHLLVLLKLVLLIISCLSGVINLLHM